MIAEEEYTSFRAQFIEMGSKKNFIDKVIASTSAGVNDENVVTSKNYSYINEDEFTLHLNKFSGAVAVLKDVSDELQRGILISF